MPRARSLHLARAFGAVLRRLRSEAGLSQEELAHRAEVSRNYVGLLEQGRRAPALGVLFALADALARSPTQLVAAVEAAAADRGGSPAVLAGPGRGGGRRVPVYSLEAAAGRFLDNRPVEEIGWVEAPDTLRIRPGLFAVTVRGRSMEPQIPDGALAVFRPPAAGDREGRTFLVQLLHAEDPEGGGAFTVKRWHSEKEADPDADGGWRHVRIRLDPLNREFAPIEIAAADDLRLVGELVRVL